MTTNEALLSIGAIVVPSIIGLVAVYYARKSAKLAEEQAEMRPQLEVTWGDPPIEYEIGAALHNARLLILITNTGKVVARGLRGTLWANSPGLDFVDAAAAIVSLKRLSPVSSREDGDSAPGTFRGTYRHEANVWVDPSSSTPIRVGYKIVYAEAIPSAKGTLELPADKRPRLRSPRLRP